LQPAEPRPGGQVPAKTERKPVERARSEEYYDVKTTVFNALIDTIDLTQLAKLEPEAAREEIRDIVSEIVAIKNVVMSIAEQEDLLQDICNAARAATCPRRHRRHHGERRRDDLYRGQRQGRVHQCPVR
jgi:hypothetical protein